MPQESVKFLSDLPYSQRKALCNNLDMNGKWTDLAGELGYNAMEIYHFGMAVHRLTGFNSPSEDLITEYSHKNPTIDELYFKLEKLQLKGAAYTLKDFVSPQALQPPEARNIRNALEGTDDETARQELPRPSQIPLQLHQIPQNNHRDAPYVYVPSPYSDSDNSSGNMAHCYRQGNGHPNSANRHNGYHIQQNGFHNVQNGHFDRRNDHAFRPNNPGCKGGRRDQFTGQHIIRHHGHPSTNAPNQYAPANHYSGYANQPNSMSYGVPNKEQGLDISFNNIKRATYGFDKRKIVSQDRFGIVYRGKLGDQFLAVKQMKKIRDDKTGFDITDHLSKEVDMLKSCYHENIVSLLKYIDSSEGEGNAYLVYPYMENGTLRQKLENKNNKESLKWEYKVKVLKEAACGLVYLHEKLSAPQSQSYVHGDISSENILLDECLTAKLTGFGLAQAATGGSNFDQHTHVSQSFLKNTLFGAQEYLPPEFKELPQLSKKGDVFAFGVVILETCTGLPAFDDRREGGKTLWEYVAQLGSNNEEFAASLNDRRQPMPYNIWEKVFNLGKKCTSRKKKDRPSSREVLSVLEKLFNQEIGSIEQMVQYSKGSQSTNLNRSLQLDFESYKKEYSTDAINPLAVHGPATHHSTDIKLPISGGNRYVLEPQQGVPIHQRHQLHGGYSVPSCHFNGSLYGQYKHATENASQSDSNGGAYIDRNETVYERPGNTVELPVFTTYEQVTEPNVARKERLEVCLEQSESFPNTSASSKQTGSDYDYATNDMSILTGSTGSSVPNNDNEDGENDTAVSDAVAAHTKNSSDVSKEQDTEKSGPISLSSDMPDSELFDYAKCALDIITAPSSIQSQQGYAITSSSSSKQNTPCPTIPLSVNKVCPDSSTPYMQHVSHSAVEALNRQFQQLSHNFGSPSGTNFAEPDSYAIGHQAQPDYSKASFSSESLQIRVPGDHVPNLQCNDRLDLQFSSTDPRSLLDDNPVRVNDSVALFAKNPRHESTASNQRSNFTFPTPPGEQDFNFNFGEPAQVSIGGCPENVAGIEKKAADLFDFDSDSFDLDPKTEYEKDSESSCFQSNEILTSGSSDAMQSGGSQM